MLEHHRFPLSLPSLGAQEPPRPGGEQQPATDTLLTDSVTRQPDSHRLQGALAAEGIRVGPASFLCHPRALQAGATWGRPGAQAGYKAAGGALLGGRGLCPLGFLRTRSPSRESPRLQWGVSRANKGSLSPAGGGMSQD